MLISIGLVLVVVLVSMWSISSMQPANSYPGVEQQVVNTAFAMSVIVQNLIILLVVSGIVIGILGFIRHRALTKRSRQHFQKLDTYFADKAAERAAAAQAAQPMTVPIPQTAPIYVDKPAFQNRRH
jgi:uncharacterized membrane protein